jgi:hypothetical protein
LSKAPELGDCAPTVSGSERDAAAVAPKHNIEKILFFIGILSANIPRCTAIFLLGPIKTKKAGQNARPDCLSILRLPKAEFVQRRHLG